MIYRELTSIIVTAATFAVVVGFGVLADSALDDANLNSVRGELVVAGAVLLAIALQISATRRQVRQPSAELPENGDDTNWSDLPLRDPSKDALGHASFANHLASTIDRIKPLRGFVIGLQGDWGGGKTTILNFVVRSLNDLPDERRPHVVWLNPWWFSGEGDLMERLLGELQISLRAKGAANKEVQRWMRELAVVVEEIPAPGARFLSRLLGASLPERDIHDVKEILSALLAQSKKKILVLVDDIDRLTGTEVRQVFRAVKAIADFPNVVYVLAYDREYVLRALAETGGFARADADQRLMERAAGEYLEKIVQAPFDIPTPDGVELGRMLFAKLDILGKDTPERYFDQNHWAGSYGEGIRFFIKTPRDVTRLVNTLHVSYSVPDVRENLNFVDFISLEALRIFLPEAHDFIRRNQTLFVETEHRERSSVLNAFIESLPDEYHEPLKSLLLRLFPTLSSVFEGATLIVSERTTGEWFRTGRVCHPEMFTLFFRLTLPRGAMSAAEMDSLLAVADDLEAFKEVLRRLSEERSPDGTSRARVFLDLMLYYTQVIPVNRLNNILIALFDVGDELVAVGDKRVGIFEWGNDTRIARLVYRLIQQLPMEDRQSVLATAIKAGAAIGTIAREVSSLVGDMEAYQRRGREQPLLLEEQVEQLKRIALQRVQEEAVDRERLMRNPQFASILYRWREWQSADAVGEWVADSIATEEGLAQFLVGMMSEGVSQVGNELPQVEYRLRQEDIEPFVDPAATYERAMALLERDWLTEEQRRAAALFTRSYERSKSGEPEDD